MTESIEIRGTAHPAPPANGQRACSADLSRAEIQATNIAGKPLLHEHDHNAQVGNCLASWEGTDGSLRVAARVTDPEAIKGVRNGTLRGLSLGTNMIMDEDQNVLYRAQGELSVCEEGRRPGTWIDTVNGKTVMQVACASKERARRGALTRHRCTHPPSADAPLGVPR